MFEGTQFQDWDEVHIGNVIEKNVETTTKQKIHKQITPVIAKAITDARNFNGMSRKDLSIKCNIPIDILKNYENGIGTIDDKHIKIISTKLGVQLCDTYKHSPALKRLEKKKELEKLELEKQELEKKECV